MKLSHPTGLGFCPTAALGAGGALRSRLIIKHKGGLIMSEEVLIFGKDT